MRSELRLVVLATQDRLAYANTFDDALKNLLEGRAEVPSTSPSTSTSAPTSTPQQTTAPAADVHGLVGRANQALSDYRRLTADGKLGEAGAKRQISGIVFGGGLALFAGQFLTWLF